MKPYPDAATLPGPLIRLPETDSALNYLAELCAAKDNATQEFTTVLTDFQTAGRGQRGNSWESETGQNLLFAFVCRPSFLEVKRQFLLSQMISLAVKETLDGFTDGFSVKWPNDIYWQEKKIGGILIENDLTAGRIEQSLIGVGINVNQLHFRSSAPNPVSLAQVVGHGIDCLSVLAGVMTRFTHYYALPAQKEDNVISARYFQSLFRKEGMHLYSDQNGEFLARIVNVRPDGALVLEDEAGRKREYFFKEVQYIRGS